MFALTATRDLGCVGAAGLARPLEAQPAGASSSAAASSQERELNSATTAADPTKKARLDQAMGEDGG
jgi:hypothetical protein